MADDIVKEAVDALESAQDGWRDIYDAAGSDLEFYLGGDNQWAEGSASARRNAGRFAITVNRMPQFVHQVMNQIRQNTPMVKFLPSGSGATPETAELLEDLYRNTAQVSNADIAHDTAAECAIKCSIGWFQLDHDYAAPDSFEQHILVRRIANPLSCIIDPASQMADGSDATFGFKLDVLTEEAFKKQYPGAKPENFDAQYMVQQARSFSSSDKSIVIGEYFRQSSEKVTILMLATGIVVYEEDYAKLPDQPPVVGKREITRNTVKRHKVTGAEELESTDFPSGYIPLVPVYGEEHWSDGKRHLISLLRNAKDPQRMHNLWASLESELLQKAPKAPYLAAEGQTEGLDEWRNPDAAMVLRYKTKDIHGKDMVPPQRVAPPPIPAGVVNARASTVEDIKAAMGMYDPSLGRNQADKSGKAIIAEQQQGDTATFHFMDNLARAIQHGGRIWLDMVPKIYDTPRIIRVVGDDGEPRMVATTVNGQPGQQMPGQDKLYDITVGKYDVVVSTGPSFQSKRQEMVNTLAQMAQGNPQLAMVSSYFIAKNLDSPGAEQMAEVIEKMLPPGLIEKKGEEVPDVRPQLQQCEQMLQQAVQAAQDLKAQLDQEKNKAQNSQAANALKAGELKLKALELQHVIMKDNQELDLDSKRVALEAMQTEAELVSKGIDAQSALDLAVVQAVSEQGVAHMNALSSQMQPEREAPPTAE